MAEGLLRHRLAAAGLDARVSSAGELRDGVPASPGAVAALEARGIDLRPHISRRLRREHLDAADLVIGMARQHVREAVVLDPPVAGRTFTLRELVARAESAAPRGADETVAAWVARMAQGRDLQVMLGVGTDPDLDIADPIGGPPEAYRRTAALLDDLLGRLVARLWPDAPGARASA
jgi:protein-tyrosine phosphatase